MYLSGPIFFGTQEQMIHVLDELDDSLEAIVFFNERCSFY